MQIQITGQENAGLENEGPHNRAGKYRIEWKIKGWKMKDLRNQIILIHFYNFNTVFKMMR